MKKLCVVLAVLVAFGLVLGSCSNPVVGSENLVIPRSALGPAWDSLVDKAFKNDIHFDLNNTRNDASGRKVTANAHSRDFPGITFIWDEKQKDVGYLKVDANLFQKYVYFVLTTKNSNEYYDFRIEPAPGYKTTPDNCYVFFIPKANGKNINMVFIGEWQLFKQPGDEGDDVGNVITMPDIFDGKYVILSLPSEIIKEPIGTEAYEVDIYNNFYLDGTPIKDYWNERMGGYMDSLKVIKNSKGKYATWIWDRPNPWIYGSSGAQAIVIASRFDIPEGYEIVESEVMFYFACDNAAVLFVNGTYVAKTDCAFKGITKNLPGPGTPDTWRFDGYTVNNFRDTGSEWQEVYGYDIKDLLQPGFNEILLVCANSDEHEIGLNNTNNPAGALYACEFSIQEIE